ncbi:MAG: dTDP-4-dehydrorhamnose reductase family protein [Flavobacteriaceae bacterium]
MKKKVLITGIHGMLGQSVYQTLNQSQQFEIYGIGRRASSILHNNYFQGDISQQAFVEKVSFSHPYDYIIHCAALVNLAFCEKNKTYASSVHVEGSQLLTQFNPQAIFIYISTDAVFNGETGNYTEDDLPTPLNIYAITKYLGEQKVLNNNKKSYVLRLNIYGFKQPFGQSLLEWAYTSLKKKSSINGYTNVEFNPLSTYQVAKLILQFILQQPDFGIYHLGANTSLSKYDFLLKIANYCHFDKSLITPTVFDDSSSIIKRPKNTTLSIQKAKQAIVSEDWSLDEGLKQIVKIMKK